MTRTCATTGRRTSWPAWCTLPRPVRSCSLSRTAPAGVRRPALLEPLAHGAQSGGVVRVTPGPLGADAVAALPAASPELPNRAEESPATARRPHAAAGGNPGLVRVLAASRWVPDGAASWAGPDRDGLLREAAPLVTEVRALAPEAAAVAGGAAVLGGAFRPADVAAVCALDPEQVLNTLGAGYGSRSGSATAPGQSSFLAHHAEDARRVAAALEDGTLAVDPRWRTGPPKGSPARGSRHLAAAAASCCSSP
ncbi:hypothetical protein ACH4UM_13725 [Streptomyces sp. NPDC020801]|uniref:hypothetical protein n=1 Tax=Streptomyces sp. NPDC020801 TaxID=3365093 RepID=UPI003795E90C